MLHYLTKERFLNLLLIVIILALFFKVASFNFVNWDDNIYILQNDRIQSGLTWDSIKWAFTSFYATNWHPLTWLSHMLDFQFYGFRPAGHHLVNVFFHLTNSLLFFYFFKLATGALWRSFLLALIFAVHPLHVESVAWVSERKDVLCAFFWLLSMIFYLRFVRHRSLGNYLIVVLTFCLGLLSKPMIVTLPFVLLLLDFWPLNRIAFSGLISLKRLKPLVIEKVPLFLLSLASCIVTFIAQKEGGAMAPSEALEFHYRVINSFISYLKYIASFFYPVDLNYLYLHPMLDFSVAMVCSAIAVISAMSVLAVISHRKRPYLLVGWLWFLGTLIPVIGFVQVGIQSMADRYTYMPLTGIILILVWSLPSMKNKLYKMLLASGISIAAATLIVLSWAQIDVWKSSKDLFMQAVKANPNNYIALTFLAMEVSSEGKVDEGLSMCRKAIGLNPNVADTYVIAGYLFAKKNMLNEAIASLENALRIKPSMISARISLAQTYLRNNNSDKSLITLQEAERSPGKNSWNLNVMGVIWSELGRDEKALENFNLSLALRPSAAETLNNVAAIYLKKGDSKNAVVYLQKALQIAPLNPEIINNYGRSLLAEDKFEDAMYNFLLALRMDPNNAKYRKNLHQSVKKLSEKLN